MKSIDDYTRALAGRHLIESSTSRGAPESRELVIGRRVECEREVSRRTEDDLKEYILFRKALLFR